MNNQQIAEMFAGIADQTIEIIGRKHSKILAPILAKIGSVAIVPPTNQIMQAFRLCSLEQVRVCIIGQDPYPTPGIAMGLSFGVAAGKRPPASLKNIYKCLMAQKLISKIPAHGDLSSWATQGVLLLNTALTTAPNETYAHINDWRPYTDVLIQEIARRGAVFILLGLKAQEADSTIKSGNADAVILKWGHPSPMNTANRKECPENFVHCDCFAKCNAELIAAGNDPINWDSLNFCCSDDTGDDTNRDITIGDDTNRDIAVGFISNIRCDERPTDLSQAIKNNTILIFTDGAAIANGKTSCISTWAYYMMIHIDHEWETATDAGKVIGRLQSNQRGELAAIANALIALKNRLRERAGINIFVISDSQYSIRSITEWYPKWIASGATKKNMDLIGAAYDTAKRLTNHTLIWQHTRSHTTEPQGGAEWIIWYGNDIADHLATAAIKK